MTIKIVAAAALLFLLLAAFRLAMGLRWSKIEREAARRAEEQRGRHVVAELPSGAGAVSFLTEDASAFFWEEVSTEKAALQGARLLMNRQVLKECTRPGAALPAPEAPEVDYEGRECWEVVLFADRGRVLAIPCGTLREGVSREIALQAFEAVEASLVPGNVRRPFPSPT